MSYKCLKQGFISPSYQKLCELSSGVHCYGFGQTCYKDQKNKTSHSPTVFLSKEREILTVLLLKSQALEFVRNAGIKAPA